VQRTQRLSLSQVLVDLSLVEGAAMLALVSETLQVPAVDLKATPGDASVLDLVPRQLAFESKVIPLFAVGRELTVVTHEPYELAKLDALRFATGMTILPVFALENDISRQLVACYGEYDPNFDPYTIEYEHIDDSEDGLSLDAEVGLDRPIVRLVNLILASCIKEGASDIHLEPQSACMRVRSRVDGLMRLKPYEIPRDAEAGVVVRVKILSKLDISEKRRPQDGKIQLRFEGRRIDIRVSTFPSIHGEKIVMRILDKEKSNFELDSIGMLAPVLGGWRRCLEGLEGILLVTGPTGSGKSSTLYATLRHLKRPEVNIVTLEDPVEYELDGITQGQVHLAAGFTFASGLRAILRQDPDIVLVGEIRDGETAEIASRAAITGHLVLATLHTNSAPAAVTRLIDLGLDPFLVGSALRGVLAQRLVRRVCRQCAVEREPDTFERQEFSGWLEETDKVRVGQGCSACGETGFAGRTGVHELLVIDSEIRELISGRPSEPAILELARAKGYQPLWSDGVAKIRAGETTPREVLRVAPRSEGGA
jgi:type IV pilus assembly protein PilB